MNELTIKLPRDLDHFRSGKLREVLEEMLRDDDILTVLLGEKKVEDFLQEVESPDTVPVLPARDGAAVGCCCADKTCTAPRCPYCGGLVFKEPVGTCCVQGCNQPVFLLVNGNGFCLAGHTGAPFQAFSPKEQ